MFNPFVPLTKPLLDAFVKAGKKYFVRQTYIRCNESSDENVKGCFILMHYDEIGEAEQHVRAIHNDPSCFLYDWNKSEHQQKLLIAANSPAGYKIYSGVLVKDWEKLIIRHLKSKVKNYIDNNLGWKPDSGDTVDVTISTDCGELYATLKLRSKKDRAKLERIEDL